MFDPHFPLNILVFSTVALTKKYHLLKMKFSCCGRKDLILRNIDINTHLHSAEQNGNNKTSSQSYIEFLAVKISGNLSAFSLHFGVQ